MNKLIATLVAGLFATAAFAQTASTQTSPATKATPATAATPATPATKADADAAKADAKAAKETAKADAKVEKAAADADAELVLGQALALHRKTRELHRNLKDAEIAFGREATERNFARIRDIQGLVSALEGTEATVEGFGTLSGHKPPDV